MTDNKRLVMLVEGNRDEDFVDWIIKPALVGANRYSDVIVYKFAGMPKNVNEKYVESVVRMDDKVLCLADISGFPCKTAKKERVQSSHIGNIGDDKVMVVIREIESWYLAGVDESCCRRLKIDYYSRTDSIDKQRFHKIIAKSRFQPRLLCALEMLRNYDTTLAKSKNKSFNYFYEKHLS